MIRSLAAALLLASGWSFTGVDLDRLRWNSRERTAAGLEGLQSGPEARAVEAFETAAGLDPENPVVRLNAGSAHLTAGTEGAIPHLELAAQTARGEVGVPANYNLGNARLAAGDTAGAVAAYEQALRLAPDHEEAKYNLELALRRQQQEQQNQQEQEQDQQPQEPNEQASGEGDQESQEQPSPEQEDEPEAEPQEQAESGGQSEQEQGEGDRNRDLPRFEEQPDMTAEQAAAILEAVENLEREQRRKQAQEEMKKRPRKGKDW